MMMPMTPPRVVMSQPSITNILRHIAAGAPRKRGHIVAFFDNEEREGGDDVERSHNENESEKQEGNPFLDFNHTEDVGELFETRHNAYIRKQFGNTAFHRAGIGAGIKRKLDGRGFRFESEELAGGAEGDDDTVVVEFLLR